MGPSFVVMKKIQPPLSSSGFCKGPICEGVMVDWWFGLVVWIPGIPAIFKGLGFESGYPDSRAPNHQAPNHPLNRDVFLPQITTCPWDARFDREG